ncbi:signal transduction histidine kinase [Bacillus pakistanensis]|uniref:histidine kinase n=2 Tax=Rossellomorea pakistanensis TaxID=992288 RepID=A0ABS2NDN5_9BACI|nr:signal transduction histidine kinase [Bacillus pakistanensis]
MIYLHDNIVDNRVKEEFQSLISRGNSHRDVLEDTYSEGTLHHIALMETKTNTEVVITNSKKEIIASSKEPSKGMREIIRGYTPDQLNRNGLLIESNWKEINYLATVTEFSTEAEDGYVYMFKNTGPLRTLIDRLNVHFLLAGLSSLVILGIIYFLLSKILTRPLIKMKEATEKLSKGDFAVKLPELGKDELGELSQSIQMLSNDLEMIKKDRVEFLASISHELRTPLTYIQGYTNVALREDIKNTERKAYLEIIQEESKTIVTLIENLFELAKIDENNFSISKEPIMICPFLKKMIVKVTPAFKSKNIDILFICKNELLINADPLRLEQIIMNLLDNALKYSHPNTSTEISVKELEEEVRISIQDQGIGIPEKEIPHLFNRLYRVEKSRSRELGGSGLGLSIVKELMDAHGGSVSITSKENQGTCVEIRFEKAREDYIFENNFTSR